MSQDILDSSQAGPAAMRGGALRVFGYGAGVLITVVSAALLFRHLGVADGGRYVTVLSLVTIVSGVLEFGLTAIGVRELSTLPPAEGRALMRNLVGFRLVLSALGILAAVGFALLAGYSSVVVWGTLLAAIGVSLSAAQGIVAASLTAELRLGWVTVLELMRQTVVALCIVALVVAGAELLPFLATPLPAGAVVLAMTIVLVRGRVPVAPSFDRAIFRELLRDVLPFAAATALSAVYFRMAMVLLSLVASPRQTGLFGASFRVIEVLLFVPNLLVGAGFPIFARAARDDHGRLAYAVERLFEVCVLVGGWVTLMLVVGAPFVIDVIAGADFAESADVLRLQAAGLFLVFAGAPLGYALLSLRRHRMLLVLTGGALVLNALLVPVLGSSDGAQGAAVATLAAELLLTVGALAALGRLAPSLGVLARALPGFAAAAALAFLDDVPSVLLMLAATVVFWAAALALRAVPEEILVELRAWQRRLSSSAPPRSS